MSFEMNSFYKIFLSLFLFNSLKSFICENTTCVVVLHGRGESRLNGLAHHFADDLQKVLTEKNMTNEYKVIEVGLSTNNDEDHEWSSFKPMSFQLERLCKYMNDTNMNELEQNCSRIQLVGCSQGALLMRGLLWGQCLDSVVPKIDKLITFGGPNSGIFGIPDCSQLQVDNRLIVLGCSILQATLARTRIGPSLFDVFIYGLNEMLSFSSYWNSPNNPIQKTTFLSDINNENSLENRTKYLSEKVKGLVVISFQNESIVLPKISTSFGFWDQKAEHFISYSQTELYQKDWIGLKALDEKHSLVFKTIPNSTHMNIPFEFTSNEFLDIIS